VQVKLSVGAGGLDAACARVGLQCPAMGSPGTTVPGQVSKSIGRLSSGGRQGRFRKDHTEPHLGLFHQYLLLAVAGNGIWGWTDL